MRAMKSLAGAALLCMASGVFADEAAISAAISNSDRAAANVERDGDRHPDQVLAFMDVESGDVVLDWGSGGGYWAELFAGIAGPDGKVYANQRAGERFDSRKAELTAQFAPFGNIDLLPVASGDPIPLDDNSVDAVMLSYIYHHMHYAEGSGESFPDSSSALVSEFLRVLKPGGSLLVIEHAAADGSSRAQSAAWHRTPPQTAVDDITGVGFEFAGDAPDIFFNPDDDKMNHWGQTGLRGNTTSLVQRFTKPD